MLPGGAVAVAFVLSLVPGWVFLRVTASWRRPRPQSPLSEIVELVAVGILTTGVAAGSVALANPKAVLRVQNEPQDADDVRFLAVLLLATLSIALVLALLFGKLVRSLTAAPQSTMETSVWWDILRAEKIPKGKVPYVALVLTDGSEVEGVLATFTWSAGSSDRRDVALRAPIKFPAVPGTAKKPPYDFIIIPGDDVRRIALKYVAK